MSDPASITLSNGVVVRVGPWKCFHCDEVFDSPVCAERHFGMDEMHTPACKIKGLGETALLDALRAALKERDEAWSRMGHEDTDTMRVLYSMQSDRHQALIREEQRGYDKGLADGRAEAALAQPARAQAGVAEERHLTPDEARAFDSALRSSTKVVAISVTEAEREEIERTAELLANTKPRTLEWTINWSAHINALIDAGLLPRGPSADALAARTKRRRTRRADQAQTHSPR